MDIFSHLVFGALMYILFLRNITYEFFFLAIFFVILPDLDVFLTLLKRKFKSNYLDHRGGSHSYIVGIIISFIVSVVYSPLTHQSFFIVWIIGSLFYGIHVSQDILTTTKIPYLFPLSKKERGFYVEKAGSLFTWINSIIFLILLVIFYFSSVNVIYYELIVDFYTYFFLFYYLYRIMSKILISLRLKDNQKYFPGILPFYFIIFSQVIDNNIISVSLVKKAHFLRAKMILNQKFLLKPEEMILYEKAMTICKSNYYYAKWTIFPVFFRNDGIFSVKFFFLEIMTGKNTMYIQYDFDKSTQQLISIKQKRGNIHVN